MKIISINISKKKAVEYQGEVITTGIFKEPVSSNVLVKKGYIEGDEQADLVNHGGLHKAIYGFSTDHYVSWRNILKRPDLSYGSFGENLSISSLDESKIFIGDQFNIGDCILEVSQPRIPCFKLGIALKNSKAAKLFSESFCTGIYFRVIAEGSMSKGDIVNKINEEQSSVSVQALFRAYFDKSYKNSTTIIARALQLETLAPEWKKILTANH